MSYQLEHVPTRTKFLLPFHTQNSPPSFPSSINSIVTFKESNPYFPYKTDNKHNLGFTKHVCAKNYTGCSFLFPYYFLIYYYFL